MTEPMKRGALAVVHTETANMGRNQRLKPGYRFEVEDYVPDGEVEGQPVAFYWGNVGGGMGNVCVRAEHVRQEKSAEEQAARRIPTPQEIAKQIGSELLEDFQGFSVIGTDAQPNDREIELYARTDEGLPFGFRVRVEAVWQVDD